VHGVRALEHQLEQVDPLDTARRNASVQLALLANDDADAPLLAEGNRAVAAEHERRLDALGRQCRHVFAVDPGVRRLRRAVCASVNGGPDPHRLLARQLALWRLSPSGPPTVGAFTAAADVKRRLSVYADEPIGARLLVLRGSALEVVDIDRSTTTRITSRAVLDAAVLGDWIVAAGEEGVFAIDPGDPADTRRLSPGMAQVVPSPETNTVWIDAGQGFIEFDRHGHQTSPPFAPDSDWLVAATSRYLITSVFDEDGPVRSSLWDRHTRRLVRTLTRAAIVAARGDVVVWQDGAGRIGTTGPFPIDPALIPIEAAAVSPTADRLAVVGGGPGLLQLRVLAPDGSPLAAPVRLRQAPIRLVWSADGRWLFTADGFTLRYARADDLRGRALRRVASSFTTLVGAF
jgi:hypothetical protein